MLMTSALVKIVEALRVVDADSKQLRNLYSVLNESLTNIERNLTTICHSGTTTYCTPPDLTSAISDPNQVNAFSLPLHFLSNCIFSFSTLHFPLYFVPLSFLLLSFLQAWRFYSVTSSIAVLLVPRWTCCHLLLVQCILYQYTSHLFLVFRTVSMHYHVDLLICCILIEPLQYFVCMLNTLVELSVLDCAFVKGRFVKAAPGPVGSCQPCSL